MGASPRESPVPAGCARTGSALRSSRPYSASSISNLKAAIQKEEDAGQTTSLSLAIEKRPLIEGPNGVLYVVDFAAFERKATHGIFHLLAEGAEGEGRDRETYSTPFGAAFQVWAEGCLRRAEGGKGEPTIFVDEEYGPKKHRRATPDVVLAYERQVVCFEVVAGALQIKTLTHGDLATFEQDLREARVQEGQPVVEADRRRRRRRDEIDRARSGWRRAFLAGDCHRGPVSTSGRGDEEGEERR